MKFQVEAAALQETSKKLASVAGKKTTIPILSHVLLDLDSGTATATDLTSALTLELVTAGQGGGKICLHAQRLSDIVSRLQGQLSFEETDGGAVLKAGTTKLRLNKLRADDFPNLPKPKGKAFQLPLAGLKRMVERVFFSVSQEESRYVLNAAQFEISGTRAQLVATDGHRLAIASEDISGVEPRSILLPLGALKLIPGFDGENIEITDDKSHLFFACGGQMLMQSSISGQFPNYRGVLPSESKTKAKIGAGFLRAVLERVTLVTDEKTKAAKFIFEPDKGLTVTASSGEVGDIEEKVPAEITGDPLTIAFNVFYVQDFLKQVEGDITFEAKDDSSAGDFRSGDNYRYIVMPTRI